METKPIETYTVRRQLSYYQSILNLKLSRSTNICAPSCVPCMRMIASLISSSVAGTETTPRLWLEATTTSLGTRNFHGNYEMQKTTPECLTETRARRWPWRLHEKLLNQRQCSNHERFELKNTNRSKNITVIYRCVPEAKGKRMKSQLIVWTSTRRFFTLPGIHRRTSSLSQLPTTSFCSKKTTNIHIYNITYFILSSNLLSRPWVSLFHHFL